MPQLAQALTGLGSRNLQKVKPVKIRAFDQEISAIPGLIKLTLGEPGFDVPEHIKAAAIKSIEDNDSHYAMAAGKPALRQAIADSLADRIGVDYQADGEILVTNGATEALSAAVFALLNPGDKVIVPTPGYATYSSLAILNGAEAIEVNTKPDDFILTPARLEETIEKAGGATVLILNFPVNPTGRTYTREQLEGLAEVARRHHLLVIADEIYGALTYDHEHVSMASILPEQTLLIDGLSKSHAMTGWRIGFLAGPKELVSQVAKIHSYLVTSINDTAQAAALEAIKNGQDDPKIFRQDYKHRRDLIKDALAAAGFKTATPDGAFYLFAQIPAEYGTDDFAFARQMAKEAKVGVIPGSIFGPGGEGYVRFSYAADEEQIIEAMHRIKNWLE